MSTKKFFFVSNPLLRRGLRPNPNLSLLSFGIGDDTILTERDRLPVLPNTERADMTPQDRNPSVSVRDLLTAVDNCQEDKRPAALALLADISARLDFIRLYLDEDGNPAARGVLSSTVSEFVDHLDKQYMAYAEQWNLPEPETTSKLPEYLPRAVGPHASPYVRNLPPYDYRVQFVPPESDGTWGEVVTLIDYERENPSKMWVTLLDGRQESARPIDLRVIPLRKLATETPAAK